VKGFALLRSSFGYHPKRQDHEICSITCSAFMMLTPLVKSRILPVAEKCWRLAAMAALCWLLAGCSAAYNARAVNSPDWRFAATCRIHGAAGRSYLAETQKKVEVSVFALSPDAKQRSQQEKKEAEARGVWTGPESPGAIVTATNTLLFKKEYRLRGSDVQWISRWEEHDSLSIAFFDYGAGVEVPYSSRDTAPKRSLCTLHYQLDSSSGVYREMTSTR
jgi:hypothetical protein